jgi:ribose transport system ATP-binding protein/D-xylose transport system ATP-binding protein
MKSFAVEALGIELDFSGVLALRGCDLRVRRGEIHALLGQNGAGKSTLLKILNGVHPRHAFRGELKIDGLPVAFRSPAHARLEGVGFVPQEIEVIENLSVAENIFCGQLRVGRGPLVPWPQIEQRAQQLLADLGLSFSPHALVASLSAAQRHLVMIARALVAHPSVLLLDEPTASLTSVEIERLFGVLRRLKERSTTIIYITHRLPEVLSMCDRASVLRDGVIAEEFERPEFDIHRLHDAMTGYKVATQFPALKPPTRGPAVLKLENFSVTHNGRRRVRDISFELNRGEILGVAGLLGAGRTELLSAIYGHLPHTGRMYIEGHERAVRSARKARALGIGLLTEDRKRDGLLFNLPLRANITAGNLHLLSKAGFVRASAERNHVLHTMQELSVKAASSEATVAHLSGGNQQKLLFARVLMPQPKILLLDDPTKGVDVATRHEIYRLVAHLAERGVAVLITSSEFEEVLGLAHRVIVLADGHIVDEFNRDQGDEKRVLRAMSSHTAVARTPASSVLQP